jgi:lipopolysaccharide transport system ATP-binding protein
LQTLSEPISQLSNSRQARPGNAWAIRVAGLSKQYSIGRHERGYRTLRETLLSGLVAPFRRLRQLGGDQEEERFWALKDVSFEVKRGEVVGIIGRNGAGKSTLLKILGRVTEPTEGRVEIRGRVASLLEVGTGFHPELSGRENIYLNGAILGMTRAEIRRKFDEIVAFAQVERFLDTPVKRYSSGMYVRLAFAVAAHLESEILVVDEVLSVGDAEFQKKCLGRMSEVAGEGRTVLLVSHNLRSVSALCSKLITLSAGQICFNGDPAQGISDYLAMFRTPENANGSEFRPRNNPDKDARLITARLTDQDGNPATGFRQDQAIRIEVVTEISSPRLIFRLGIGIQTMDGTVLLTSSPDDELGARPVEAGLHVYECHIPKHFLNAGTFNVTIAADVPMQSMFFFHEAALRFEVLELGGRQSEIRDKRLGLVRCPLLWRKIVARSAANYSALANQP